MKKLLLDNYLFLILFIIILFKDNIYNLFLIEDNLYTPLKCQITADKYNDLLEFSSIDYIYDASYLNSYIIYKDIYNYINEITIRGGLDYDLDKYPVVYDNTLVGVISKVADTSSIVKLITNKDSKISVKVNDSIGVLESKDNKLVVSNISNYSNINIGDNIYTSGLGNLAENIYIGTVKDIQLDHKNIEKIITVDYKLDIKKINYVTIIKETL